MSFFKLQSHSHFTKLAKHVWVLKKKFGKSPSIKWKVLWRVKLWKSIGNVCRLYQEDKLSTVTYPDKIDLLNQQSEVMSKCSDTNKYEPG